jgi:hypothetical protein
MGDSVGSWIVSVLLALVGVVSFLFRKQIQDFLQKLAKSKTDAADTQQEQKDDKDNKEQEDDIKKAQDQIKTLEDGALKRMLDGLSYSELVNYATEAFGQDALMEIQKSTTNQDEVRAAIYSLYASMEKK